jgi:hypothetical protein
MAKGGDPRVRDEVGELERILATSRRAWPLSAYERDLPPELEPLTNEAGRADRSTVTAGSDLKLEAELAELPPEEAAEFREWGPRARAGAVEPLRDCGPADVLHGWRERDAGLDPGAGADGARCRATIHTDIARGFIRCEVIAWRDLVEAGSRAEAARRGQQRLEGKDYVVARRGHPQHPLQRLAAAAVAVRAALALTASHDSSFHR